MPFGPLSRACVARPRSPEKPARPVPANVEIFPPWLTLRTPLLEKSAMDRIPCFVTATPCGLLSRAAVARPPSPEKPACPVQLQRSSSLFRATRVTLQHPDRSASCSRLQGRCRRSPGSSRSRCGSASCSSRGIERVKPAILPAPRARTRCRRSASRSSRLVRLPKVACCTFEYSPPTLPRSRKDAACRSLQLSPRRSSRVVIGTTVCSRCAFPRLTG
jgi:hypothetical protein